MFRGWPDRIRHRYFRRRFEVDDARRRAGRNVLDYEASQEELDRPSRSPFLLECLCVISIFVAEGLFLLALLGAMVWLSGC